MSLQDEYFDLIADLEERDDTVNIERVNNLYEELCRYERFKESAVKALSAIEKGRFWRLSVERGDWKEWLR